LTERLLFILQMQSVLVAEVWSHYLHQMERKMVVPTYEFSCPICNVVVEQYFTIDSDHIINCGDCNVQMDKKFSATPVHFKGTGFYKTGG
jgi:putative FmdB family regulatory protein